MTEHDITLTEGEPEAASPRPEVEAGPDPPMIYVASLADYTNGHLHGAWLDATCPVDGLADDIDRLLATSPLPAAEEYAVHDHSGFGAWRLGEYESLETITAVAQAIVIHGEAITYWIDYLGEPEPALSSFTDAYLGSWPSLTAYAEHLVDDLGVKITVQPESWATYVRFDTDALARDLDHLLYTAVTPDQSVQVFDPTMVE